MKFTTNVLFGVFLLHQLIEVSSAKLPEDGRLNFTALANKYGYPVDEHDVITEDGYILKLFRIKGNRRTPVLFMHGLLASADVFILRGSNSLALTLAKAGYDIWAGNTRGSPYSRKHITLDPDKDNTFWDFSFHEMGYLDLPAIIDYILKHSGVTKLNAIGHSQGNMIFYVLGSTRPEYNEKINLLAALAPVCYIKNLHAPWPFLVSAGPIINEILKALNDEELLDYSTREFIQNFCTETKLREHLCTELFFELAGYDPDNFEDSFMPVVIGHFPTSTSRKNLFHVYQIASSKAFSQFDHGSQGNFQRYGSDTPPEYDLSKVTMGVYLYAGKNDRMSSIKDVNLLARALPNVKEYIIMKWEKFNHIDYIWGNNIKQYLLPHLLNLLNEN